MRNYGSFFQEGGQPQQQGMPVDQMVEGQGQPQQGGGQEDQVIAQKFLEAFAQLPQGAQQMIAQAIIEMVRGNG